MGHKSVCLECRKAFNNSMDSGQPKKEICPDCGAKMHLLHHMFRPPKKSDVKKWQVVKFLVEKGFKYYHNYEMTQPGVYLQMGKYPETMKEALEFVENYHPNGLKKK